MHIGIHTATLPAQQSRPNGFFQTIGPAMHVLLRIGAALMFMQHGVQKLFGWLGGVDGSGATVELVSQMGLAGILELVGGFMILVGVLTRPVALILTAEMIAAYAIAHLPQGGLPVENHGELALMYALVFAHFFGNGAGRLSIDQWLGGRHSEPEMGSRPRSAERMKETEIRVRKRPAA
jgi:putative oxidoreductase